MVTLQDINDAHAMINNIRELEANLRALSPLKEISFSSEPHGNLPGDPTKEFWEKHERLFESIQRELMRYSNKVSDLHIEICEWPDDKAKAVARCRINGDSYKEISWKVFESKGESTSRMYLMRFLDERAKCAKCANCAVENHVK